MPGGEVLQAPIRSSGPSFLAAHVSDSRSGTATQSTIRTTPTISLRASVILPVFPVRGAFPVRSREFGGVSLVVLS